MAQMAGEDGMDNKLLFDKAVSYITALFKDNSGGHGTDHTFRVYRNAMYIAENEHGCDKEAVGLAALLHDADDYKLFKTVDNSHARAFLRENGFSPVRIDEICKIINSVSFSQNKGKTPDSIEGKVVQDADRLDAIGAVGIARTFAYGGENGRTMGESITHFYDKLLLLRDLMNTETAKRIAIIRHEFMKLYLKELFTELKIDINKDGR